MEGTAGWKWRELKREGNHWDNCQGRRPEQEDCPANAHTREHFLSTFPASSLLTHTLWLYVITLRCNEIRIHSSQHDLSCHIILYHSLRSVIYLQHSFYVAQIRSRVSNSSQKETELYTTSVLLIPRWFTQTVAEQFFHSLVTARRSY